MSKARATARAWRILAASLLAALAMDRSAQAQSIDDGVMLAKGEIFAGDLYTHDQWDEYWEGGLKRDNGNIGTLTTRSHTVIGVYGVTNRLNLLGNFPYIKTSASQGVLRGENGVQDLSIAAKYTIVDRPGTAVGALRLIGVFGVAFPLSNYNFDFAPFSIGSGSKRATWRGVASMQGENNVFVDASAAFTWRANVELDRPYYFTNDQLYMTSEVDMPPVADWEVMGGYRGPRLMAAATLMQQRMSSGGDIRRQDMPFVSNRMNATRVGGVAMVPIPKLEPLAVRASYAYTISGRNVGQSSTASIGLVYRFRMHGRTTP